MTRTERCDRLEKSKQCFQDSILKQRVKYRAVDHIIKFSRGSKTETRQK